MIKRNFFARISILAFAMFFCTNTAGAKSITPEWIIRQNNQTIYASHDAIKIIHPTGFNLISKAPEWKVYAVRDEQRIFWCDDLIKFDSVMMIKPLQGPQYVTNAHLNKFLETTTVNGMRCAVYRVRNLRVYGAQDVEVDPKGLEFVNRDYLFLVSFSCFLSTEKGESPIDLCAWKEMLGRLSPVSS